MCIRKWEKQSIVFGGVLWLDFSPKVRIHVKTKLFWTNVRKPFHFPLYFPKHGVFMCFRVVFEALTCLCEIWIRNVILRESQTPWFCLKCRFLLLKHVVCELQLDFMKYAYENPNPIHFVVCKVCSWVCWKSCGWNERYFEFYERLWFVKS